MDHKFKSNWESSNFIFYQKDHSSSSSSCSYQGYSWARRNFTCNFCNKEYKSAQALGGHMNIHRRDKAKLGLSSHHPNPNYPNPNNISPPSPAVRYLPYHSSVTFPMTKDEQPKLPLFACSRRESMIMAMEEEYETRVWKKYEILNMEMEMGLIKDGNIELDLELRLGR